MEDNEIILALDDLYCLNISPWKMPRVHRIIGEFSLFFLFMRSVVRPAKNPSIERPRVRPISAYIFISVLRQGWFYKMFKNKAIEIRNLEDLEDQLHVMNGVVESLKKPDLNKSEIEVVI